MSQDDPSSPIAVEKVVIFSLGKECFAFRGREVKEILPVEQISPLPGSPEFFWGVCNIRGNIESVLDIHRLLEMNERQVGKENRIIIVGEGEWRSGILIDSVLEVADLPIDAFHDEGGEERDAIKRVIVGLGDYCGRTMILIDSMKLFKEVLKVSEERE